MKEWTVILLYPDYLTGDFGADIYVGGARNEDPYEATKDVQRLAALANSEEGHEDAGPSPDDFRPIAVMEGNVQLELDATNF